MLDVYKCIFLLIKRLSYEREKYPRLLVYIIYGYLILLSVLHISLHLKLKACALLKWLLLLPQGIMF